jgi:DNA-binding response OmpR family regulator
MKKKNILVIDDDLDIGRMIKMLLEYKGYSVTVLEKTEQASEIIRNNQTDLVIMDMLLSGVNGIDVCARFKKDHTIAHIPVIMISAHPDAKKICLEAGANDFISKPFEINEIFSRISFLLNKAVSL